MILDNKIKYFICNNNITNPCQFGLENYKIPEAYIAFITSYLEGRRVILNYNCCDYYRAITLDCPQGSVLAPLLWNLYVNVRRFHACASYIADKSIFIPFSAISCSLCS